MSKMKMLDHQKLILKNSLHDNAMFYKELTKSIKWLKPSERRELFLWLRNNYWDTHKEIIKAVFNKEAA